MRSAAEQFLRSNRETAGLALMIAEEFVGVDLLGNRHRRIAPTITCDNASSAAAVMLHLRSCYVSKAAILTLPGQFGPVENRSPS
jgi:hypothetical protein